MTHAPVDWHLFDPATFHIGRIEIETGDDGHNIGLYSVERSIVGAFKLRGRAGYELGIEALRN